MEYYTKDSLARQQFIKVHKFLFSEAFKNISSDAKLIYSLFRDRLDLSIQNNWIDEDNHVYCKFSNKHLCKIMGKSHSTIIRYKKELRENGLIKEKRQLNTSNKIYVLKPASIEIDSNSIYDSYINKDIVVTGLKNLEPNKTNINKTENNKTDNLHDKVAYIYFEDLKDDDVVKETNNIISPNRSKIKESNYDKAFNKISYILVSLGLDNYNECIRRYLIDKPDGRSIENFIEHLNRYEKEL